MNVTRCSSQAVWLIGVLAAMLAGCATIQSSIPKAEDISGKRRERSEAALRRFDETRDRAEFEAAQAHWSQGDADRCRESLEELLERNPDHLDARLLLAELLLDDNRPEEALRYLQPATEAHADDAQVQYIMGLVLDSTGQRDAALAHYERAARLEPDNEVYAVSYQPEMMSAMGLEEPPESFAPPPDGPPPPAEVSSNSPNDPGQEPARLRSEPVSPDNPSDSADSPVRGDSADSAAPKVGDSDRPKMSGRSVYPVQSVECTEAVDCAGDADPANDIAATSISASVLIQKGAKAIAAGSVEVGQAYFWEAAALRPDDPQIPISAAVSSLRHNQPEVAVELLEPAVAAFPDSAALQRILGTAYYRRGDYKSSQLALQHALSLDKSSALSYFLLGCTLVKLGQSEAAETCFRQARVIDPRYAAQR